MKRLGILFLGMLLVLSGCRRETPPKTDIPQCRYVTRIDIHWEQGDATLDRAYTRDSEMESILLYLRLLQNDGTADTTPEIPEGGSYAITLTMSDGSSRVYRQKGAAYFSREDGQWLAIKPRQGRYLLTLLRLMPGEGAVPAAHQ